MKRSVGLFGRAEAQSALDGFQQRRSRGEASVLVLAGVAGMGKSELVSTLPAAGTLLARIWPPPAPALAPAVVLASGLLSRGADASTLGAHGAVVDALLGRRDQRDDAHRAHPLVVADALVLLWSALPVPRRPLLVLEDVHWADDDTWSVVRRLIESAPSSGCSVLVTSRPEGPRWDSLEPLFNARGFTLCALGPLPPSAVRQMVASCLETDDELPGQLLDLVDAAGGVPLLVEEILADLERLGALERRDQGWDHRLGDHSVPPSILSLTQARLRAVAPTTRQFVERSALLGTRPDSAVVAGSLELAGDAVAETAREAQRAGLLQLEQAGGHPVFRHELLREAVLASMLDLQRRDHALALLAEVGPPAGEEPFAWAARVSLQTVVAAGGLAEAGRRLDLVSPLFLAAARRYLEIGAPLAAAASARTVLAGPGGSREARVEAQVTLTEALALAGEVEAAIAAAAMVDALLPRASTVSTYDPGPLRSRAVEAVARATGQRGDWAAASRLLGDLDAMAPDSSTSALAALAALEGGRYDEARRIAQRVLGGSPAPAAACEALEVLGRLARRHDLVAAEELFGRAAALADAEGLRLWHARALHELATLAQLREFAVAPLYAARKASVASGAPGLVTAVDFHLSALHGVRFEPVEALTAARQLLADARRLGARRQEAWAWILIGQAHAVGGRRTQAEAAGREAVTVSPHDPEIRGLAAGTARGLAALLREDTDAAFPAWAEGIRELRALPAITPLPPWYLWPILATVANLEGDGGARARAETEHGDLRTAPGLDALWNLAAAASAGRAGHPELARRHAATAEASLKGLTAFDGWRLLALRWVAADAIDAGWGEPARWMPQAADYFGRRGFTELSSVCRALGRRAGAPQRRRGRGASTVPPHLHALGVTSREMDVLGLVAEGLTNAEVAGRLVLSPRTVKGYVEQLLAKTGAANRTQLTALALNPPSGGSHEARSGPRVGSPETTQGS